MPWVRFTSTSDLPTFRYAKQATVVRARHGDGTTTKIRGDGYLRDGDAVDAGDFEAQWCQVMHPDNFELVEEASTVKVDADDYTKDELLDMADQEGLDVSTSMTKAEIAAELNSTGSD